MLGVKTGYRTWGFFWIPRSTSVWSAICTKKQTMWNIESLHHICQHQFFSLKPGPQHIRGKKYLWVWQLEFLVFCRPGKENYKKFSILSLWTKKTPYLRYPLWGNKAGGLDHWQACFGKHVYQLDFLFRRNNFLKYNETINSLNWLWWEVECNGLCSHHQSRLPFPFVCTIFAISGITGVQQKGGEAVTDKVKQSKWLISPALILM